MQRFTKTEIVWITNVLKRAAKAEEWTLRAEQYREMAEKLQRAIDNGSKRIEITY